TTDGSPAFAATDSVRRRCAPSAASWVSACVPVSIASRRPSPESCGPRRTNMTDSLRIARTFSASRARVYRAWTDAADLARWYAPGDGMQLSIDALDVRVGGRYHATFG